MKNRLPVDIENIDLPELDNKNFSNNKSYGYVSIFYILGIIITFISVVVVLRIK